MCIFLELFIRLKQDFVLKPPNELSFWRVLRGWSGSSPPLKVSQNPSGGIYHSRRCLLTPWFGTCSELWLFWHSSTPARCDFLSLSVAGLLSQPVEPEANVANAKHSLCGDMCWAEHTLFWGSFGEKDCCCFFLTRWALLQPRNLSSSTVANLQVALVLTCCCASVCDAQELSEAEFFSRSSTNFPPQLPQFVAETVAFFSRLYLLQRWCIQEQIR